MSEKLTVNKGLIIKIICVILAYFESLESEVDKLSEKDWICTIGRFLTLGEISLFKKGNYLERF